MNNETLAQPRLSTGIELVGRYEGSGFKQDPYLARREDGQIIQLAPLLFFVAEGVANGLSLVDIASEVKQRTGKVIDEQDVAYLIEGKLTSLGLVDGDGHGEPAPKVDPLLALKFRGTLLPPKAVNMAAALFKPLFFPPLTVLVVIGAIALDAWVFGVHGVAQAVRQVIYSPALFLAVFGLILVSTMFHEVGHATACRYGGARPGRIGFGLYLAWPAFYTDVTDAYRLGKAGRVRTDLGGVYFNAIFSLIAGGLFLYTRAEWLILLIMLQQLEIIHQMLPFLRLDGYYLVADLTGVPDLFSRIKPILQSAIPGRETPTQVKELKSWVRWVITLWVLMVVPILLMNLSMLLLHAPRIFGTGFDALKRLIANMNHAFASGRLLAGTFDVIQVLLLVIPLAGLSLMFVRLGKRSAAGVISMTKGKPLARAVAIALGLFMSMILIASWLPSQHYKPITPSEKGTIEQGIVDPIITGRNYIPAILGRNTVSGTNQPRLTTDQSVSPSPSGLTGQGGATPAGSSPSPSVAATDSAAGPPPSPSTQSSPSPTPTDATSPSPSP
ncbi:MAG: hypothetical protein ABR507_09810 [Actinomycetota bacterium]|nr:hypothetical protein [Actinomycetota bacterium]